MSDAEDTPPTARSGAWLASRALLGFALVAVSLLALVDLTAAPRIAEAEARDRLQTLQQVLPPGSYDNDLLNHTRSIELPAALSAPGPDTIWQARLQDEAVAVILPVRAPDGYSGAIDLLVGIAKSGKLLGVRVTQHRETPGLGDAIDIARSDWILQFDGRALGQPPLERWKVRKDGGDFDQLTGATITPRAIVKAVRAALRFHQEQAAELYSDFCIAQGDHEQHC